MTANDLARAFNSSSFMMFPKVHFVCPREVLKNFKMFLDIPMGKIVYALRERTSKKKKGTQLNAY